MGNLNEGNPVPQDASATKTLGSPSPVPLLTEHDSQAIAPGLQSSDLHTNLGLPRSDSDGIDGSALRVVTEALASIEQKVKNDGILIRQLANDIVQESSSLGPYRQRLLSLVRASSPPLLSAAGKPAGVDLCIHSLGPFEVYRGDEIVPLRRTGSGSTILKFLALKPRQPVSRDLLLEALWPGAEPTVAKNRLRVAMHRLRQAFVNPESNSTDEDYVIFRDGCYQLNPETEIWTDTEAFENNWQVGLRLERAGHLDQSSLRYAEAEALYRGDLLEEDLFEEWTLLRREVLKDTYLTILHKLSRYWLQLGNLDDAIENWKKILAKDPWREDIYRRLMASNAQRGQRGLALRWYEVCKLALRTQLNVAPEQQTLALHQRILEGQDVSEWAAG